MKVGIEVEGRLKGIPTLFMSAKEFRALDLNMVFKKAVAQLNTRDWALLQSVSHFYISDDENELFPEDLLSQKSAQAQQMVITLERTSVTDRWRYPANVGVMLRVGEGTSAASFFALAASDQIKFSRGPQDEVYCVTKECMMRTNPSAFLGDVVINMDQGEKQ